MSSFSAPLLLACLGLVWWFVIWSICLLGLYAAKSKFAPNTSLFRICFRRLTGTHQTDLNLMLESQAHSTSTYTSSSTLPGVSILRPLYGLDSQLYDNLKSSFLLDYPHNCFEILFSVPTADDPCIPVVRSLMTRHPNVNAHLIIGQANIGINPKINNLIRAYTRARYDYIWILDSNVFVKPATLFNSIATFTDNPNIGLVHHVPFPVLSVQEERSSSPTLPSSPATPPPSTTSWFRAKRPLGSHIESAFLGSTHAKMYLAINYTQIDSCINGKSNMFRRSDLRKAVAILKRKQARPSSDAIFTPPYTPHASAYGTANKIAEGKHAASPVYLASKAHEAPRHDEQHEQVFEQDDLDDTEILKASELAHFSPYLGEDNMIGHAIWHQLSMRHAITSDIAWNVLGSKSSFKTYFDRRIRWIRVRKFMVVASTLLEPLTESVPSGLIGAFSFAYFLRHYWNWFLLVVNDDYSYIVAPIFLAVHLTLWFTVDTLVFAILASSSYPATSSPSSPSSSPSSPRVPPQSTVTIKSDRLRLSAWLIREFCAFPIWAYAMAGSTVLWREGSKRAYKVLSNGKAIMVDRT